MVRYSMHLRDGTEKLVDRHSREFSGIDALRPAVITTARDLLSHDAGNGRLDFRYRIDAEDEKGAIVYSLQLEHAYHEFIPMPEPDPMTR